MLKLKMYTAQSIKFCVWIDVKVVKKIERKKDEVANSESVQRTGARYTCTVFVHVRWHPRKTTVTNKRNQRKWRRRKHEKKEEEVEEREDEVEEKEEEEEEKNMMKISA